MAPGVHGVDVPYTFYNEGWESIPAVPSQPPVQNTTLAHMFQKYLTNFAIYGDPNGPRGGELPEMKPYGRDNVALNINVSSVETLRDPSAKEECIWWQKGLYF